MKYSFLKNTSSLLNTFRNSHCISLTFSACSTSFRLVTLNEEKLGKCGRKCSS